MTDQGIPEGTTEHPFEYGSYDPSEIIKKQNPDSESADNSTPNAEPLFDEKHKEPFTGLLYLGALTKSVEWVGHTIVVRTLTTDDELAIGQVTQQWMGTNAVDRAYVTAVAAMALVSLDGKEPPIPVGPTDAPYAWAYGRFNWLKANAYRPTIDKIFNEYLTLEAKSEEVVRSLEKASGSSAGAGQTQSTTGPSTSADELDDSDF